MYILLTDETNQQPSRDGKFFVYGGLFFPIEILNDLDSGIEKIRHESGYRPDDIFKFDTHTRPTQVSFEQATEAKTKTIDLCIKLKCQFIVHVILHDIIKNQDLKQYTLWAADFVIGRYNFFLTRHAFDSGISIIDNLPEDIQYRYLSEKFSKGLHIVQNDRYVRLDGIKLFASTCIGASHANSAMDIVLGSFRYCINNPHNIEAAKKMMKNNVSLLWHKQEGETIYVNGMGLILRPELNKVVQPFRQEYDNLIESINNLIKE